MLEGRKHSRNLYERSFIIFFWSLSVEMTWKISALWRFEVLGVFVNKLSPGDKCPIRDCENLEFLIQMQLS